MSDFAIQVQGISKQYRIGQGASLPYKTLREQITGLVKTPWRRLRAGAGAIANDEQHIWALRDVSFNVQPGEVVGIIGRNGAGKSTLLKILSRITEPTRGTVDLYGRVGSLLEVGTGFHPELTGRENVFLNGAILGMHRKEIERKFDEIVDFAEIEKFIDTPVKFYSSGMYMRLAFSVAAHLEPEILLVDEVLAVGDAAFQKKCLGKMGDVAEEGRTVLLVSHNLAAVRQICQHGILLEDGQLVKQGSIDEVIQGYIGGAISNSDCVVIKPQDHATGLNGIRVHRAWLLEGVPGSFAVPWRRPIHLRLDIEVTKPFQHVNFGLGVASLDGVPIMTVHSTDLGAAPVPLQPGFYQIEVNVENPLRLGIYSLILGAHEAIAKTSIFYIPNAIRLEVVNASDDMPYFEHNTGLINGVSAWAVSECSAGLPAADA